jgi:NAD(P)-dependent dehydrogenase (short-subunit alcohol dehydrogenase family)
MPIADGKSAIVISASSDIGAALATRWLARDWHVWGTYRTHSSAVNELQRQGAQLLACDLTDRVSVQEACHELRTTCNVWDTLVLCPGLLEPVGPFEECDFDAWESSLSVNLVNQLRIVRELLPTRRRDGIDSPTVLFMAGGGTNNASASFSAYTLSKIALIKMCELLDCEIPDTRFVILGPGWVKTKIHDATLAAGERAGSAYERTLEKLRADDFTSMETVLDACDWATSAAREAVGGRNFSVVHDAWTEHDFNRRLLADPDMCKLRRHGNERAALC